MDASAHFRDKKITVMGLGLLGRGTGDARYLAECGAELVVTDLKSEAELAPSLEILKGFPNITYVLGEHRPEDFQGRDLILKAAGVPLDSPFTAEAKENGIPVRMSADLFATHAGIPIIGITGTRGKSTTTYMLAAILEAAGRRVILGGNVRGISTLALLPQVRGDPAYSRGAGEIAVLELDSWQLQGWGEANMSPQLSIFTTFYPDHLNYYADDVNPYLADKANIFLHQNEHDKLILGNQAADVVRARYQDEILSEIIVAGDEDVPADWILKVPGAHNRYDAACALAAARTMGVADDISRAALESFAGVPGRLELVREANGVRIYNDTNSTTPEATLAALTALDPEGKGGVVLIMGGNDKGLDMNRLLHEIPKHAKRVIMLAGTGTARVLEFLPDASVFDSLGAAFQEAVAAAMPGDTILFSPAFSSFGMFKNEYDRGDTFNALVRAL